VAAARQGVADRRNGSYSRHLLTAMGDLELCVPRTRRFSALAVLQAYARRERHVDRLILACFLLGLSTRKAGEALMTTLGERVSPATVTEVAKLLDREVAAFHRRPLRGPYRLLIFDGVVLSRRPGAGALRRRSWWRSGWAPTARRRSSTLHWPPPRARPPGRASSPSSSAAASPPRGSS
jgi:transposase-like protein